MVWLAYDGSLHSEWLTHYAIRCAQGEPEKTVRLVYVQDGALEHSEIHERLARLERRCSHSGVSLAPLVLPLHGNVASTLLTSAPLSGDELLLCGTRIEQRRLGFLSGTVSEALLHRAPVPVVALHVATPGLLGAAERILLPVMGHPRKSRGALAMLRTLAPGLKEIFVLSVHRPGGPSLLERTPDFPRFLEERQRWDYVDEIKRELDRALLGAAAVSVDRDVVVSSDPAEEIVVLAKQHKAQLILLGMSERSTARRMLGKTPSEKVLRYAPCDVGIHGGGFVGGRL